MDKAERQRPSLRDRNREAARDIILDAAERLLQHGAAADFSMRALAAEAGVGFATPFNHFGTKTAIMQALSDRLIARMAARFGADAIAGDAIDRVLGMARIGVAVLLERPEVHKAVVASLGAVGSGPSAVRERSQALWALALADGEGVSDAFRASSPALLAGQLAIVFRGSLSFWIAGEIPNDRLVDAVETAAAVALLGFAGGNRRKTLLARIGAA